MKTTIELPDALVKQAQQLARAEGATLRALVEEGLQHALRVRQQATRQSLDFPIYGGSGLTESCQDVDWAEIRLLALR